MVCVYNHLLIIVSSYVFITVGLYIFVCSYVSIIIRLYLYLLVAFDSYVPFAGGIVLLVLWREFVKSLLSIVNFLFTNFFLFTLH